MNFVALQRHNLPLNFVFINECIMLNPSIPLKQTMLELNLADAAQCGQLYVTENFSYLNPSKTAKRVVSKVSFNFL